MTAIPSEFLQGSSYPSSRGRLVGGGPVVSSILVENCLAFFQIRPTTGTSVDRVARGRTAKLLTRCTRACSQSVKLSEPTKCPNTWKVDVIDETMQNGLLLCWRLGPLSREGEGGYRQERMLALHD